MRISFVTATSDPVATRAALLSCSSAAATCHSCSSVAILSAAAAFARLEALMGPDVDAPRATEQRRPHVVRHDARGEELGLGGESSKAGFYHAPDNRPAVSNRSLVNPAVSGRNNS